MKFENHLNSNYSRDISSHFRVIYSYLQHLDSRKRTFCLGHLTRVGLGKPIYTSRPTEPVRTGRNWFEPQTALPFHLHSLTFTYVHLFFCTCPLHRHSAPALITDRDLTGLNRSQRESMGPKFQTPPLAPDRGRPRLSVVNRGKPNQYFSGPTPVTRHPATPNGG